ncbi:interleukin-17 receptor C-like [Narcine bancroftii]|uniref:interleukin-17 receptor C-like n=1 Tax=Narcine bancroftii TaxID=1343680 RepID=UPI003831D62F
MSWAERAGSKHSAAPTMRLLVGVALWFGGVHSLEKFPGPWFEAACLRGVVSCEAMNCGPEKINEDIPPLLLTNLTSSTILYCEQNKACIPCIRVQLTASLAASENVWSLGGNGSGSTKNKDLDTDEDNNEVTGWIYISTHQPEGGINLCAQVKIQFADYNTSRSTKIASVELSCFPAAMKSEVRIKAFTTSEDMELGHIHKMEDCTLKDFLENIEWCKVPKINITLENDIQMAVVNVPQNYYTRFKYEVMPPFESKNPLDFDKLKMTKVYRNFSDIVPCLCMELWSATIEDARRRKECPFSEIEEFQENVWKLSSLAVEYKGKALQWTLASPCNMSGEILLCSKSGDGEFCQEIPHSKENVQVNKMSEFKSVDPHPSLCVKIISGEHVNISCPFDGDVSPQWRMESILQQNNVTITIIHGEHQMNFSVCIMEGNKCRHSIQNIQQINQNMKQINLDSQDCLQIWRSDVKFSPRIIVCPFEMYRRVRWTLFMVLFLIPIIIMITTFMVKRDILKDCKEMIKWDYNATSTDSPINRKVLLLYSVDHSQFEKLVNTFASILVNLNFKVVVDLWNHGEIGRQGPLLWFHSQKLNIAEEGGKIIILFSKSASIKCDEWLNSSAESTTLHDPYDGFMASLNCVLPDITLGNVCGKYVMVYFEELMNKTYIPEIFNKMPTYNLPLQVAEFLQEIGLPAKCIWEQKKYDSPSSIHRCLSNVIKECQVWEKSHSNGFFKQKK